MNTLYSKDNPMMGTYKECSKISLEQCYSCKRLYNYEDTNCFLTYCYYTKNSKLYVIDVATKSSIIKKKGIKNRSILIKNLHIILCKFFNYSLRFSLI